MGYSQPTISRLITALIPILTDVLTPLADRVAERELRSTVRVDGFLAPIVDRRANTYKSGMYSGKNHRCGVNVQVVASWHGRLVMTGDPTPGRCTTPAHGANPVSRNGSKAACIPPAVPERSLTPATPAPVYSCPNAEPALNHSARTLASSTS